MKDVPVLNVDIHNKRSCKTQDYFSDSRVVFLETRDESLVSTIRKIVLVDNKILIQDSGRKCILAFDSVGKYLYGIFPQGRGPGEFIHLCAFTVDWKRKEIIINTDVPQKFMFYNLDGQFKREVPVDELFYGMTDSDGQLICITNWTKNLDNYLCRFDFSGGELIPTKLPLEHLNTKNCFAPGVQILKSERINFSRRNDPIIYSLDGQEIQQRYKLDFGKNNLPSYLCQAEIPENQFQEEVVSNSYIYSIPNIKETPERIFFSLSIPGMGILSKSDNQVKFYQDFRDSLFNIPMKIIEPLEDVENRWFCFRETINNLKVKIGFFKKKRPTWFEQKLADAKEDDNPVLFFYKSDK